MWHTNKLSLSILSTYTSRHANWKRRSTDHSFSHCTASTISETIAILRKSIAWPICRAFDRWLELRVEKCTLTRAGCRYTIPTCCFCVSFYFSHLSLLLFLSISFTRFPLSFPLCVTLHRKFAKLTRDQSPRMPSLV